MKNLKEYYINADKVAKQIYNYKAIQENKKELLKIDIFKDVYNHLLDVIPDNTTIELLKNINYHSIIWEYLRSNHDNVNGLMNEFKQVLYKNICDPFNNSSKLNALNTFNTLIYLLISA